MNANFLNPTLSTASGQVPLTSLNTIRQGMDPAALDLLPPSSFLFNEGSYYVDSGVVKAKDGSAVSQLPIIARSMVGVVLPSEMKNAGQRVEKLMKEMPKTTPLRGEPGEQEALLGLGQGVPSASSKGAVMFALADDNNTAGGNGGDVRPAIATPFLANRNVLEISPELVPPGSSVEDMNDRGSIAGHSTRMRVIKNGFERTEDLNEKLQHIIFGVDAYERVITAVKRVFEKKGDLKTNEPLRQELLKELAKYREDRKWCDEKFSWLHNQWREQEKGPKISAIQSLLEGMIHANRIEGQILVELKSYEDAVKVFDNAIFYSRFCFTTELARNVYVVYRIQIEQAEMLLEKADALGHMENMSKERTDTLSRAKEVLDYAETLPLINGFDGGKREEFAHWIKLSGLREEIARGMGDSGQLLGIYAKRLLIYNELGFYMRDQFAAKKINADELAKSERECLDATVDILRKKMDVWRSEGHFGLVAKAAEDIRKVIHSDAVSEYRKTGDKNILYKAYERMREYLAAEAKALEEAKEYLNAAAVYARLMTINKVLARHPLDTERNKFYYNEAARDARYFLTDVLKKDEKAEKIIRWAFEAYISSPWRRFWVQRFNMSMLEIFVEKYGKLDKILHKMRDKLKNGYTTYDRDFSGLGKFNNNLLEFARHDKWTARTGWRKDVPLERDLLGIPLY